MSILFNGFHKNVLTFESEQLAKGKVVTLATDGKAVVPSADGAFMGVVDSYRANLAGIQLTGYVEVEYTGTTAPTLGYNKLTTGVNGAVKVSTATGSKEYLVLKVNSTDKIVGFIL